MSALPPIRSHIVNFYVEMAGRYRHYAPPVETLLCVAGPQCSMQELMQRRPTGEHLIELPDQALEEFRGRGFTSVPRITTDEEIEWLREVHDLLFSDELQLPKGALVRMRTGHLPSNGRKRSSVKFCFRNRFIRNCARPFSIATRSASRVNCLATTILSVGAIWCARRSAAWIPRPGTRMRPIGIRISTAMPPARWLPLEGCDHGKWGHELHSQARTRTLDATAASRDDPPLR